MNYLKDTEKLLKRFFKKKVKITTGVVVTFLLSCNIANAVQDISITYKNGDVLFDEQTFKQYHMPDTENRLADNDLISKNNEYTYINTTLSDKNIHFKGLEGITFNFYNKGSIYELTNESGTSPFNIYNTGVIRGNTDTGIAISNTSENTINKILNIGLIVPGEKKDGEPYGRAIHNFSPNENAEIEEIINLGMIGNTKSNINIDGITNDGNITKGILNIGIISGTTSSISNKGTIDSIQNIGSIEGKIHDHDIGTITNFSNLGTIFGKEDAIDNENGKIENAINYGIIIGGNENPINNFTFTKEQNKGIIAQVTDDGYKIVSIGDSGTFKIEINNGTENIYREYTIKNIDYTNDSSINKNDEIKGISGNNFSNNILNGLENVVKVTDNTSITNSIVNGYKNVITFDDNGGTLNLSGSVINGGLVGNGNNTTLSDVIIGGNGNDEVIIDSANTNYSTSSEGTLDKTMTSNTIINGHIKLEAGDDTLTISKGTVINGRLDGGDDNDTLNFKNSNLKSNDNPLSAINDEIAITHNINGFETINVDTTVTLFAKTNNDEDLKVTGTDTINIGENGKLNIRIDPTNIKDDKYIGHALYDNKGISFTGNGILNFYTNGIMSGSVIAMNGATYEDGIHVITNSILTSAEVLEGDGTTDSGANYEDGDILIEKKSDLEDIVTDGLKYEQLNKIYKSIYTENFHFNALEDIVTSSGDETTKLEIETKQLKTLLTYLGQVYTDSPYSLTSDLSRKSADLFKDTVLLKDFKADTHKWIINGGLTHIDGGSKNSYYGKNYYGFDTGSKDVRTDAQISGAYVIGEYGVSDTLKTGIILGGNKTKSEYEYSASNAEGNGAYLGVYADKYINNIKLTAGTGIQYSEYDTERYTMTDKYSEDYSDLTYNIYLSGKYSYNLGNNIYFEPYATLSYDYIDQEGADEGNKALALKTDDKTFDILSSEIGADLKKVITQNKLTYTFVAGVSYERLLDGYDEEYITGRIGNGSDFDLLIPEKEKDSLNLNIRYQVENEKGLFFNFKGEHSFEHDNNRREWTVGAGVGYKF